MEWKSNMPLDLQYLRYCQPGNPFYAPPVVEDTGDTFDVSACATDGWSSKERHPWVNWLPTGWSFPRQGWKIHVSATSESAEAVLSSTAKFCFRTGIPFKHLATARDLLSQNSKYADRSAAGKFITIYPSSDEEFVTILEELDSRLTGNEGPYILSDKRWGTGPVYFRYGAFVPPPSNGSPFVSTLIDPDGNEVEDPRRPAYTPPDWAVLPEKVAIATRDDGDVHFPFKILNALHFSNGGGVYLAEALNNEYVPSGTRVVLKEARPYAGLDVEGIDAVTRLEHEANVLRSLKGLDCVPTYYGAFTAWEHRFIVMEHIQGQDLKREWMTRTPVLQTAPWNLHDKAYLDWVTNTVNLLDKSLSDIHEAGWLLGDIHPKNVIMRDGVKPCFIDFEFAHCKDPSWRCQQGAPGYEPFAGLTGFDADRWSMGMLELDLIYPQATIADQGNVWKIKQLLDRGAKSMAIPESVRTSIHGKTVDVLPGMYQDEVSDRAHSVDSLTDKAFQANIKRGLLNLMDLEDEGPLVPGDIALFADSGAENEVGYPYGAAGVIEQLHGSLSSRDIHGIDEWLSNRVSRICSAGLRGWEGLAHVAHRTGLDRTLDSLSCISRPEASDPTLWSGWAGVGLYQLASGGDPLKAAHQLEKHLDDKDQGESVGLLHGWCAAAIFFTRLYQQTGESKYISLATRAIEADLSRCVMTKNATLEFDEGWRTLPYLGVGSLGVGLAILELQRVTDTEIFSDSLSGIDAAATYYQCGQASLAHGLSGFLIYLMRRVRHRPSAALEEVISSHLQSLRLHSVTDETGLFFRGNQNLRLSADYLTGASGVLAALNEIFDDKPSLPFGV